MFLAFFSFCKVMSSQNDTEIARLLVKIFIYAQFVLVIDIVSESLAECAWFYVVSDTSGILNVC